MEGSRYLAKGSSDTNMYPFREAQIQSSVCHHRIQTGTRGDYDEIFLPVVNMTTLRLLLGVMVTKDIELEQLNVMTTFLHGHLEEDKFTCLNRQGS